MQAKQLQKIFYFSDENKKKFIGKRVEDIAAREQRSSSYVIERLLLDGLLPGNEEVRFIILTFLYPDDGSNGVRKTLDTLFSHNSAGENWCARHDNLKPVVEYCLKNCDSTSRATGDETELPHLISQFKEIVKRIDDCALACIEPYDREVYLKQSAWAKVLLQAAEKDEPEIVFKSHFQLVLDCWDMIDNWTITFRYLSDLASMYKWEDNSTARNTLCDIINEVSKEW